jgi:hypothetical protein
MELTPEELQTQKEEYIQDLKTLSAAQVYVTALFGEDSGIDYVISECQNYVKNGKFSDHCYEYAQKGKPPLTEAEIAETLPKTWDGKPIWGYKDFK